MQTPVPAAFLGVGWAFPPRVEGGDVALTAYDEDVRQAVLVLLRTEPGERVMRPTYGAGLRSLAFEPLTTTTAALVRHRVETALVLFEPRIDSVEVTVTPPAGPGAGTSGRLDIAVGYRVRTTNTFYNLVYPFYLAEGSA